MRHIFSPTITKKNKMNWNFSSNTIEIGVVDLEGCFPVIKDRLLNEGAFQLAPKLDFKPDVGSPAYSAKYSPPSPSCAVQMFIVKYRPKFSSDDISQIQSFQKANPSTPFITVVLNQPAMSWGFSSSKSKIEKKFQKLVPNSYIVIVKYNGDNERISNSDLSAMHASIENILSGLSENYIKDLMITKLNDKNFFQVNSKLTLALMNLGYHTYAFEFALKLLETKYVDFWPEKPMFYDIQKEIINATQTGFDVIITALSYMLSCAKKTNSLYFRYAEQLTCAFAKLLNESGDDNDKLFFVRSFIHFSCSSFCDAVESIYDDLCGSFSLIGLSQIILMIKLKPSDSVFLTNIPPELRDHSTFDQLLLADWGRTKKLFAEYPNHQKFFDSLFFNYLTSKDDKNGALQVFNSSVLMSKKKEFFNYFENDVLLQLFEWKQDPNLANSLISSNIPKDIKIQALKVLPEVYPMIPLNPKISCPRFFTPLELFDHAQFSVQFNVPDFLIGETVSMYALFESSDRVIKAESSQVTLNKSTYVYSSVINCINSGNFTKMELCIEFNTSLLKWALPLYQPLIVKEYSKLPEITLESPYLLSPTGEEQVAIVNVENLDIECVEIGFSFEVDTVSKIECNGVFYEPFDEIIFKEFGTSLKFTIYLTFVGAEYITVNYRYIRKDLENTEFPQSFDFNQMIQFKITLFQQNKEMQQFQIKNPFPTEFTFDFLGKTHVLPPNSDYYLLREKSELPLEIVFKEKGWENFPVRITTSSFHTNDVQCHVKFDGENWKVGEPRVVEVEPGASPIIPEDNNDWIVSSTDSTGVQHIFIPTHPGSLTFPQFLVNSQIADSQIETVQIIPPDFPIYVSL